MDEVEEYHSKVDELTDLCQQLQNAISVKTEEVETLREQVIITVVLPIKMTM